MFKHRIITSRNEYTIIINDLISSSTYVVDSSGVLIVDGKPITLPLEQSTNFILESVIDINSCTNYTNDTAFVIVNQLPLVELDNGYHDIVRTAMNTAGVL